MDFYKLLQIIGLALDMVGVLVIFLNSPINDKRVMMGGHVQHTKNNRLKIGLGILLLGLVCQVFGVIIQ